MYEFLCITVGHNINKQTIAHAREFFHLQQVRMSQGLPCEQVGRKALRIIVRETTVIMKSGLLFGLTRKMTGYERLQDNIGELHIRQTLAKAS
jgi:hypothetical protein